MNWNIISLALAAIWLCAGVGILWVEHSTGKSLFGGAIISPGWLCLVVAAYNLLRVLLSWGFSRSRAETDEEIEERR